MSVSTLRENTTRTGTNKKKGLVIVNTGPGKGKTTAALGTALRAWGWGWRICVIQFIKSEKGDWGEVRAARKLGIEWHTMGDGFTWRSRNITDTIGRVRAAWELAQQKIVSGEYDLIVLDEMTYALRPDCLDAATVVRWIRDNKPAGLHLIITGRNAAPELVEFADLVTEMCKVRHPFDSGVVGQRGIEF